MKTKRKYCWTLCLQVNEMRHVDAKRFMGSLRSSLLVIAALLGTAQAAIGQDVRGFLATAGVDENGDPVIDFLDSEGTCVEAVVQNASGIVGCAVLDWHGKPDLSEVVVTFSLGATYHIPASNFHPCPPGPKRVIDQRPEGSHALRREARRAGPSPSPTPIVVPISNDADSLAVSCDGRFGVVVGSTFFSQSNTPVSLVDLDAHIEVATVPYPDRLGYFAAIGDDGQTVLVSLQDQTGGGAPPTVRRLVLDENNGTLTDAGVELAFGSNDYLTQVGIAPGSHVGTALVQHSPPVTTEVVSFTLSDMQMQDSVTLAGSIGNAVVFNCTGDKVYARSGSQALDPDVIEGFVFDPLTGMINHTAFLTINDISIFYGARYGDPLAISSDSTLLFAAEENQDGRLPAPRVSFWDAVTGTFVDEFTNSGIAPHLVATVPCCALGPTPTPTLCTGRCTPTPRPRPTPHPRPTPP